MKITEILSFISLYIYTILSLIAKVVFVIFNIHVGVRVRVMMFNGTFNNIQLYLGENR